MKFFSLKTKRQKSGNSPEDRERPPDECTLVNRMPLTNAAGGLIYHWRAARFSRSGWAPFRTALAQWLGEWAPPERDIILIGPSAGYCLTREFITRFDKVIGVEPDPVARLLFVRRHRPRQIEWCGDDFFTGASGDGLGQLRQFLEMRPGSAVLFCNFLGQLKILVPWHDEDRVLGFWKENLVRLLKERSFASFHDRVSGPLKPRIEQVFKRQGRLEDSEIISLCYDGGDSGELIDHETGGIFDPRKPHTYFAWPLTPGQWHLIEATKESREIDVMCHL